MTEPRCLCGRFCFRLGLRFRFRVHPAITSSLVHFAAAGIIEQSVAEAAAEPHPGSVPRQLLRCRVAQPVQLKTLLSHNRVRCSISAPRRTITQSLAALQCDRGQSTLLCSIRALIELHSKHSKLLPSPSRHHDGG